MATEVRDTIKKIYRHVFNGGTIDQIDQDNMVILIMNPAVKKGVFTRKSYGTLYNRCIVYMDKTTGYSEIVLPSHWSRLSYQDLLDKLKDITEK